MMISGFGLRDSLTTRPNTAGAKRIGLKLPSPPEQHSQLQPSALRIRSAWRASTFKGECCRMFLVSS